MSRQAVDLGTLIARWRAAFDVADHALAAGSRQLPPAEVRERARLLGEERAATAALLDELARDRHAKPALARLVATHWEAKRLLGLPADATACVFNLDGLLVGSAAIHAEAWRETFDEFIARRVERTRGRFASFDPRLDYARHLHARPRLEGVRAFLASRGISLPEGSRRDPPGAETVHGLARRKNQALLRRLDERGVSAFDGARLYLELAHDARLPCAVVSPSANAQTMLDRAALGGLVDERVDGNTMLSERLRAEPAPDTLLAAARRLGADPGRTAVFETTRAGVAAGRAGRFELVVGVAQDAEAAALRAGGADLVVGDLGELLERKLAGEPAVLQRGRAGVATPGPARERGLTQAA